MRTNLLVVACVAVLVGAWFASRSLTSEVPVPPAPQAAVLQAPVGMAPPPSPGYPSSVEEKRAALLQGNAQLQPVAPPPPTGFPRPVQDAPPPPPAEAPESPFRGESKELEYVEKLLGDRGSDATKIRSAYDVLQRCLKQEPDNERCQDDMETARIRLRSLGAETSDPPGVVNPKLLNELPQQPMRKLK
jgi:hypothetical protein